MKLFKEKIQDFVIFDQSYALPLPDGTSETKGDILMAATILFAQNGYAAVSMKDIAGVLRLNASSIYNYYDSKVALWTAALDHAKSLYVVFLQNMEKRLEAAGSFAEVLHIMFDDAEKMENDFTCYAFSLIQVEQFHSRAAGQIYTETLISFAVDIIKKAFDNCIVKGYAKEFDTYTAAVIYTHTILTAINISVHKLMSRPIPYEPGSVIADIRRWLYTYIQIP